MAISFETEQQRINSPECYFNSISEELRPKRDEMTKCLQEVGIVPTVPDAGYFIVADFSNLSKSVFTTLKPKYIASYVFDEIFWKNVLRFYLSFVSCSIIASSEVSLYFSGHSVELQADMPCDIIIKS